MERDSIESDILDYSEEDNINEQLDREMIDKVRPDLPKSLYHYCSYKALDGILSTGSWWFGSINGTNDMSETDCLYVKEFIKDKNLIQNLDEESREDIILAIKRINDDKELQSRFIVSFSEVKDDEHQWEKYGDNFGGVCIEIDPAFFSKFDYRANTEEYLTWTKISYDIQTHKHELQKVTDTYIKEDGFGLSNADVLAWDYIGAALNMKSLEWEKENEWRLVLTTNDELTFRDRYCKRCFTRNGRNYYDFDLVKKLRDVGIQPIKSITLGSSSKKTIEDTQKLVQHSKFNITNIFRSQKTEDE